MATPPIKKVVLAYSGGLDTSIILKWLQTEYGAEVVTFTADLGQGEEIEPARAKGITLEFDAAGTDDDVASRQVLRGCSIWCRTQRIYRRLRGRFVAVRQP